MPREGTRAVARGRGYKMSTESNALAMLLPIGLELAKLGIDVAMGKRPTPTEIARETVDLVLRMVPREELIAYLTEGGVMRAEIAADVAETAKFGFVTDPLDEDDPQ